MIGRNKATATQNDVATTLTTVTENDVATTIALPSDLPGRRVLILGTCVLSSGTGTTTVTVRIRQGDGITGTIVYDSGALTAVAGEEIILTAMGVDLDIGAGPAIYSLTVQQGAATANGSVDPATIAAISFS